MDPNMSMTVEAALAPSGWYPDPAGSRKLRWWNGTAWTDHVENPRPEVQPAAGFTTGGTATLTRRF